VITNSIITEVIEQMNSLPDKLQQQVLTFILTLRQEHLHESGNAWDVLESLATTITNRQNNSCLAFAPHPKSGLQKLSFLKSAMP
jgi:hypothetical protein